MHKMRPKCTSLNVYCVIPSRKHAEGLVLTRELAAAAALMLPFVERCSMVVVPRGVFMQAGVRRRQANGSS